MSTTVKIGAAGVDVLAGGEHDGAVDGGALDHRAVRRACVGQDGAAGAGLDGEVPRRHERVVQRDVGAAAAERHPVTVVELDVQAALGPGHGDDEAARADGRDGRGPGARSRAVAVLEVELAELLVGAERATGQGQRLAGEPGVVQRLLEVADRVEVSASTKASCSRSWSPTTWRRQVVMSSPPSPRPRCRVHAMSDVRCMTTHRSSPRG